MCHQPPRTDVCNTFKSSLMRGRFSNVGYEFVIRHLPREENGQANALAQQASSYSVGRRNFNIRKPMRIKAELQVLD